MPVIQNFQAFMATEPVCTPDKKKLENSVAATYGLFVVFLLYPDQSSFNITQSSKK